MLGTRASLSLFPAFANLDMDTAGNPCVWRNSYSCRECTSEQIDWSSDWSCQCNDACPNCGAEIEPTHSEWIGPTTLILVSLWEQLPEAGQ